jgi:hypothetical protein
MIPIAQFQFVVIILPVFFVMAGIGIRNLLRKLRGPNPIRNSLARIFLWLESSDLVEPAGMADPKVSEH